MAGGTKKNTNPIDTNTGRPYQCGNCKSIFHFSRDCPDKDNSCFIQLFTSEDIQKVYMQAFVGETLNSVVLDSACTKTVCGKNGLNVILIHYLWKNLKK